MGRLARSIAALVATLVLFFATPASFAQTAAAPEQYNNTDEFGVDLVTGSYNFSFVEGSIGPDGSGLSLVRLWTRAGWQDNWSGDLRRTVEGSTQVITITFGGRSERFTLQGSAWQPTAMNGATLTVVSADEQWLYTAADGTAVTYKSPLLLLSSAYEDVTISMPTWACSAANAAACGVPVLIDRPNDQKYYLTWHTPQQCVFPAPEGEVVCTMTYRLTDVRAGTAFAIKITYLSDQDFTGTPTNQGLPPPNWWRRSGARFFNLAAVQCTPQALNCASIPDVWPKVTYGYPNGATRDVTLSSSGTWRFTTGPGGVVAIRRPDATADTTVISYNSNDRVTSITSDGASRSYSWSMSGSTITAVATDGGAGGGTMTVVTDANVGRPTTVTNSTSNTVTTTYDLADRITRVTLPEGNYINYTRNARGDITETRMVAKPGSGLADIVSTATFPATCVTPATCNQPLTTVDPLGHQTDYTYSATHGELTRVQLPAPVANGVRPEINYSYTAIQPQQMTNTGLQNVGDPIYKVTEIRSCATAATCAGSADETVVTIAYNNPNVLPTSVTTRSGNNAISSTTSYAYDPNRNLTAIDGPLSGTDDTTTFIYDSFNRRRGVIGPDPDGTGTRLSVAERYSYDAANRIIKVERGNVTAADPAALEAMTALQTLDVAYNADGDRIRETASSGSTVFNIVQYSYNPQRRLLCTALRMNPSTWGSLPSDACTATTAGTSGPDRITRNNYDLNNRITSVETGVGSGIASTEVTTTYTANGQTLTVRDGENNLTTYVYDGHDRLSRTRYPVTTRGANASSTTDFEQLTYDANSRVTSRLLRGGTSINMAYDRLGRLTYRDMPGSEPDVALTYDLAGRMTQAITATSQFAGFAYDALGRMTAQSNNQGVFGMGYDAAGRRTLLVYPDNFYVNYDYDTVGNVTRIRENGATSGVGVLAAYSYDMLGRRSMVNFGNGTSQILVHDNADRLTSLSNDLANTANDVSVGFTYNPASQIARLTRDNDSYAWTPPAASDVTDTHNGLNQIMLNGLTTVSHDARGNLTMRGASNWTYNADNLMLSGPGGTLSWDPLGRLNKIAATGQPATRFAYDGIDMVVEYANDVITNRYVHGPGTDNPIVWYVGSGTADRRFLMADERGSIVSVTNASGGLIGINRYDEYGVPASGNIGRFQYTGQQWLPEVGLYHYKARMYSPTLGRFMQTDPIGYVDGLNWYAYVGDDPVNFVDPLGLSDILVMGPSSGGGSGCSFNGLDDINVCARPRDPGHCAAIWHRFGSIGECISYGYSGGGSGRGGSGGGGLGPSPPQSPDPNVQRENCDDLPDSRLVDRRRASALRAQAASRGGRTEQGFARGRLPNGNIAVGPRISGTRYNAASGTYIISEFDRRRAFASFFDAFPNATIDAFEHTHPNPTGVLSGGDRNTPWVDQFYARGLYETVAFGADGVPYCTDYVQ